MTIEEKKKQLDQIFAEAKKAQKRSYAVYSSFSNRIFDLGLDHRSGETALKKLAKILKV